ncbi:putative DNA double-strand break repair Rad50 ATPase [Gossypium australe]|uniref:Putative DNA double-strand break repair Rad50 ATPase n=1 Tax=Gossypium australe TaxID=47621 RepID=A0A5B6WZ90_9ROSI|nr:putative DNA double-strand break repair Rad50 ATPase [Gossypium australe]
MKGRIEELESALQSCELRVELLEVNEEHWKEQLHHSQSQVRDRDYIMGEAVAQIREVADHLQTLVVQADTLSVKYELESDRGQELALLLRKIKTLSIRAKPYLKNQPNTHPYGTRKKTNEMDKRLEMLEQMQKEMQEQMQEHQLLNRLMDKGKNPMVNVEENTEYPQCPPGFTPPHVQTRLEVTLQRPSVTIRLQQFQAGASVNLQTGSSSGDNLIITNVPDLDEIAEGERTKVELPKQLEDRCKWLEEKFKEIESADNCYGIDAKDLSLVLDLVIPYKFKMPEFEKYNGTSCPEAHITMFCRRMTGYINNDQLLIHCFQDSLVGAAAKWYN